MTERYITVERGIRQLNRAKRSKGAKPMNRTNIKTKGKPCETDVHVGHRLRLRRSFLGLSQEKLADALELTFQQVQKYERGVNRISAGRLWEMSKILDVPVSYFYEGLERGEVSPLEDLSPRQMKMVRLLPVAPDAMQKAVLGLLSTT